MPPKVSITKTIDNWAKVSESINTLAATSVLVGIPGDKAIREKGALTNAALGYIQEKGAPEISLPARPFLEPGVASVNQSSTIPGLKAAGVAALAGDQATVIKQYTIIGQRAADAVRTAIRNRIPPPLKPGTLLGRLRRKDKYQKAAKGSARRGKLRAAALAGSEGDIPLLDTGALMRSVTFVIRRKGKDVK
jgi:hypothetical protein